MDNLHLDLEQARETLTLLQNMIQQQRAEINHGTTSDELEMHLLTWEELLRRIQGLLSIPKNAKLNQLYEVSRALNASLNWQQTLEAVLEAVIRLTGAERGLFLTVEAGTTHIQIRRENSTDPFKEEELALSQNIAAQAIARGTPLLTTNAQLDSRFQGTESIVAYHLRSVLCTPILWQNEPLGVIYLENRVRSGIFGQDDILIMSTFAEQAALALANARQHQRTDHALTERIRELTILQEMARDLNSSLNYQRVLDRSLAWAMTAAGAESGALGLLAEEGTRWVAQVGSVQPDVETTQQAQQCLHLRKAFFHTQQVILPLLREERPIGVLYLCAGERPFGSERLEFVARMADNAAIAIENVRLYEALRQANQAKSEFISLVSHELHTPMTSILGYSDMLIRGMVGELTSSQREFVISISRSAERMRLLVRDLLDISRIETGRLSLAMQSVPLPEVLDEVLGTLQDIFNEKELIFITDIPHPLPALYGDPNRLVQIFTNLLGNAIKYTPYGGTIAIRAQLSLIDPGYVQCSVIDTGIGISPENQRMLFTKFFRADDPTVQEQPGTGLGLAITKNLVELQGGRIWVESEKDKGSIFHFTIPIALPDLSTPPLPIRKRKTPNSSPIESQLTSHGTI